MRFVCNNEDVCVCVSVHIYMYSKHPFVHYCGMPNQRVGCTFFFYYYFVESFIIIIIIIVVCQVNALVAPFTIINNNNIYIYTHAYMHAYTLVHTM